MEARRSKRRSAVSSNISRANDADKQRMREKRINKLERDAADDVGVDVDADDEDFDVRVLFVCARACTWIHPCVCVLGGGLCAHEIKSHPTVQGSDSDEEVTSKKRKATKRRSSRTQGGKKQAVSLSKNFTEVRPTVQATSYPLLPLRQCCHCVNQLRPLGAHPAAGNNGVRQVSEACPKLSVCHDHPAASSAAALLCRVR